jgi:hypothetical protein
MQMQDRLLFVLSPPRAGSTLLQHMLGSHSQIATCPEPHLITPLAYLGYHDLVDKAPYDHVNAAEAIREFVDALPRGEDDYLEALRAYTDTLYGRMLAKSGRRYFLDKTPANALVLPFLRKLYPNARYVVLTRNPLAVMSSYANSFFDGDWRAANEFNPVANRYVPAIARFLREPTRYVHQVGYEALVADPNTELERICRFLDLPHEPEAVNYGEHFAGDASHGKAGSGDPISVAAHSRPTQASLDKWIAELLQDDDKLALAREIVAKLDADDVRVWGYDKDQLLAPFERARREQKRLIHRKPKLNSFVMQRKIMLVLKKDIEKRPHGKLLQRVRYYCNVLLRE